MKSKFTNIVLALIVLLTTVSPASSLSILPTNKLFVLDKAFAVIEDKGLSVQVCTHSEPPQCHEEISTKKTRINLEQADTFIRNGSRHFFLRGENKRLNTGIYQFEVKINDMIEDGTPEVRYLVQQNFEFTPDEEGEVVDGAEITTGLGNASVNSVIGFLPFYRHLDVYRVSLNKTVGPSHIATDSNPILVDTFSNPNPGSLPDLRIEDAREDKQLLIIRTKSSPNQEIKLVLVYKATYFNNF